MTLYYVLPNPLTPPTEGPELDALFQQLIEGLTGLPTELVRPRWQPVDPKQPERNVNWCALGVESIDADDGPAIGQEAGQLDDNFVLDESTIGPSGYIRHETISVLATFYGPQGQRYAAQTRDGVAIPQNVQSLLDADAVFVDCGPIVSAPELINQLWFKRYDLSMTFRRKVTRTYPTNPLISAEIVLKSDTPGLLP